MDYDKSGIKIDKLNRSNYHIWKQKIELILAHREVDDVVDELNPFSPTKDPVEYKKWEQRDKQARVLIGLSLSDDMLENIRGCTSSKSMLDKINNVFRRRTLLNKMRVRREFHTVEMRAGEGMLSFINRVKELGSVLRSMEANLDEQEIAMTILCGLPPEYEALVTTLDALSADSAVFNLDLVESRLLQEEQRQQQKQTSNADATALISNSYRRRPTSNQRQPACTYCGRRGHSEQKCWDKHPSMRPQKFSAREPLRANQAFVSSTINGESEDTGDESVCLFLKPEGNNPQANSKSVWFIDSGASAHMTHDKQLFSSLCDIVPFPVQMGDNSELTVTGKGVVDLKLRVNGAWKYIKLQDVLYVPYLKYSLISTGALVNKGAKITYDHSGVQITKAGKLVAAGNISGSMFIINALSVPEKPQHVLFADCNVWHARLGHIQFEKVSKMSKSGAVRGLQISGGAKDDICKSCTSAKLTRKSIPKSSGARHSERLGIVYSDVCGPLQIKSKGGARYFVTFIDDYSRWTIAFTIRAKSEVFSKFKEYLAAAERITGNKVRALHTDNGGEYTSGEFVQFMKSRGIASRRTCANTPQQNGIAERLNRTLLNMCRAMLEEKRVPKEFWADAITTAVYLQNRITSSSLPINKTPYELWHNRKPDISHFRVFGSPCWYHVQDPPNGKLGSRAKEAILIGYASNHKAYKLYDFSSSKVVISRDVIFEEAKMNEMLKDLPSDSIEYPDDISSTAKEAIREVEESNAEKEYKVSEPDVPSQSDNQKTTECEDGGGNSYYDGLRRSARVRRGPGQWWKGTSAFTAQIADEHLSYSQATKGEEADSWAKAIQSEMESLKKNGTWVLVPQEQAKNLLTCKWVFKRKDAIKENGTKFLKYKARLVTRGFQQLHGIDYDETFAPVVKHSTLRIFLAIVAVDNLELHQMDVKTAFLNGDLDEDIYMKQPEGFVNEDYPNHVCKLVKALYGLKQAPRKWFEKINTFLCSIPGFESCPYDPCFYVRRSEEGLIMITLYVDDLLIAGKPLAAVLNLKKKLSTMFEMEDCGEAKVCLGLEITRNREQNSLKISQKSYLQKVLCRFGMDEAKSVCTPMQSQIEDSALKDVEADSNLYSQAIGSLMYLMVCTRPDIAFAVGRLSQYMNSPTMQLWTCVKRVFRYLQGTRENGITYTKSPTNTIHLLGYSDSDWAGCKLDRKSTSGYVFCVSGGAVSWKSKKQTVVTTSTAEAEYMALGSAAQECVWLGRILNFAIADRSEIPSLLVDNQGSIRMAKNDISGNRTKHIDIKYHLVRDLLRENHFALKYCASAEMTADIFTKPLDKTLYERFRAKMGLL